MTVQNKETYLENMNGEYKQKYYPEGSVFKAHKKAMSQRGPGPVFYGSLSGRQHSRPGLVHKQNPGNHTG